MRRADPLKGVAQMLDVLAEDDAHERRAAALPALPLDIIEWTLVARPLVEGRPRDIRYFPFWLDILRERHHDVMVMAARQTFKTTTTVDLVLHAATTRPFAQVLTIVDNGDRHRALKQKLRIEGIEGNTPLKAFPRSGTGNENEISLLNSSTIYTQFTTAIGKYQKMEGKSPTLIMLDEAQYQPLEDISTLEETTAITHAPIWTIGIGGEAGSPYDLRWRESDQREWHYDDPNWRDRLQFDRDGLVLGPYLTNVLKGKWVPTVPKNSKVRHGYHVTQEMHPLVPLTTKDAIRKYRTAPKYSVEAKRQRYTPMKFSTHVLARNYRSARRPITPEMMLACSEPYSALSLLSPPEVRSVKKRHGEACTVCFGCDWGSGPSASSTVFAVLIYWKKFDVYQLVHLDPRPRENLYHQAKAATDTYRAYNCDIGVADLGYGSHQVKAMQAGSRDPATDEPYQGLSHAKLLGCRTLSAVLSASKPFQYHSDSMDEHGDVIPSLRVSKTAALDEYIAAVEAPREHPATRYAPRGQRPRLIIPYAEPERVAILHRESIQIVRKDLDVDAEDDEKSGVPSEEDIRQFAVKEYMHPPDSVMAVVYAILANLHINFATKWHVV